jgi:hypothetical protein
MNDGFAIGSLLRLLSAQDDANNTDNRNDTKLPCFAKLFDFSVSYWLLMLYRKTRNLFPEDFKPLASLYSKTDLSPSDNKCQIVVKNAENTVSELKGVNS